MDSIEERDRKYTRSVSIDGDALGLYPREVGSLPTRSSKGERE